MERSLFEITADWTGNSYLRAYAWADNEEEAKQLFMEKVQGTKYATEHPRIRRLMSEGDAPFCTEFVDDGWPE